MKDGAAKTRVASFAAWLVIFLCLPAGAMCQSFEPKGQHAVVLGLDSNQVYLAVAPAHVSLSQALRAPWEVHAAPRTGGAMVELGVQPKRVKAWSGLHNIQHVAVHSRGSKAVIAAQQWGNDLDLFLSHRLDSTDERGGEVWTEPRPLDGLNSTADEVFPRWEGQDVTFASNRTGAFRVYDASSALQLLRATPREDVPSGMEEVLSVVTVGPGFSWVTGRLSKGTPLAVTRWDWPQAASPIPEGWTVCVTMADQTEVAGTLVVRAMDTREVVRTLNLDADGCASLKGLPADKSWAFKWRSRPDHPPQMSSEAIADIRSPDGRLVRRYTLSAKKGWSFVMLPLDAIQALSELRRVDDSEWPKATFALLNYAHGEASPLASSLRTFKAWAKQVDVPLNPGHWSVVGHADASGSSHDNDRLSLRRAQLIASFLVDEMGWPRASVEVRAAGSAEPLGEDPAQNRRVEVKWVPSMQ